MKTKADAVRAIDTQTQAKQAELQPIADKVNFINAADKSGAEFWDRFNKINRWLAKVQVHTFTITPPDTVTFTCTVGDTAECARFVLNLLYCPYIQKPIQVSGLPKGLEVKGVNGATGGEVPAARAVPVGLVWAAGCPECPAVAPAGCLAVRPVVLAVPVGLVWAAGCPECPAGCLAVPVGLVWAGRSGRRCRWWRWRTEPSARSTSVLRASSLSLSIFPSHPVHCGGRRGYARHGYAGHGGMAGGAGGAMPGAPPGGPPGGATKGGATKGAVREVG